MIRITKRHLLLPLLALGLVFAVSVASHAPASAAGSASVQIHFGDTPQWGYVQGTRVREIRQGQHPDYDVFRYGNRYYARDNDRWYASNRMNGRYRYINDREVPNQFNRVPAEHWKHYPSQWNRGNDRHMNDNMGRDRRSGGNDDRK